MKSLRAFIFSLEAAFSLTLLVAASAYLLAFSQPRETAGEFLACSDIAGALAGQRAFSSQESLDGAVLEAGRLSGACIEAQGAGLRASSCGGDGGSGAEKYSFSFPAWKGGHVQEVSVGCRAEDGA